MDRVTGAGDLHFPQGFLWGAATSAHQVEGQSTGNDWWAFEQRPGAIWNRQRSGLACDWWRNAERDFDLMAELGHTAHRLSVDWSRIEPEEGAYDAAAVARYRQMLTGLRERRIEPMVTLHHFATPMWLARRGGWRNSAAVRAFARFAGYAAEQFGDLVTLWCTVNEPSVYAFLGYLLGEHAPGERSLRLYFRVLRHLLLGHAAACRAIHSADGAARVGLVHNFQIFEPLEPRRGTALTARLLDYAYNGLVLESVRDGRLRFPMGLGLTASGPLADSLDFVGVNYYNRRRVTLRSRNGGLMGVLTHTPGAELSDNGRHGSYGELYAEGMGRVLRRAARLGKPLYITENGLPDNDDDQRPRFLVAYLAEVQRALAQGVDVRGYFHWSLTDNFEWSEGWGLRFGLVALDETTQERRPRPSSQLYAEIIRANAISRALVSRWAPESLAQVFPEG